MTDALLCPLHIFVVRGVLLSWGLRDGTSRLLEHLGSGSLRLLVASKLLSWLLDWLLDRLLRLVYGLLWLISGNLLRLVICWGLVRSGGILRYLTGIRVRHRSITHSGVRVSNRCRLGVRLRCVEVRLVLGRHLVSRGRLTGRILTGRRLGLRLKGIASFGLLAIFEGL